MGLFVESQVEFQTILVVLKLSLIILFGVIVTAITVFDRQVAQISLSFSTISNFLNTVVEEINRYRIRKRETEEPNAATTLLTQDINEINTQNRNQITNNGKPVSMNWVFLMSTILFLTTYSYHPLSIVFGRVSTPVFSRYDQSLSYVSNKNYTTKNFNVKFSNPLYPLDAEYGEVDNYWGSNLVTGLYNDSINGNALQLLGTTFYQSGNLSCGIKDGYNTFMLETKGDFSYLLPFGEAIPTIDCVLDSGTPGSPIEPTFLNYRFNNEEQSYVKTIGKVPTEGDNFTVFVMSGNDTNSGSNKVKFSSLSVFLDKIELQTSPLMATKEECLDYINKNLQTLNYSNEDAIYGVGNAVTGTDNLVIIENLNKLRSLAQSSVNVMASFAAIFTVKDSDKNKLYPKYNHYIRNSVYFKQQQNAGVQYYQVYVKILHYTTGLAVFESLSNSVLPKGTSFLTLLYDDNNKIIGQGDIQMIPPMLNVKALPTAASIVSAFIPTVNFQFMSIDYEYGHRLTYDVTALVSTVIGVGALALILGLICRTVFYKEANKRIPQYYNLLRDYHQDDKFNVEPLITIVKPAFRGVGAVQSLSTPFNHIGVLSSEASMTKPLSNVKYLGKDKS